MAMATSSINLNNLFLPNHILTGQSFSSSKPSFEEQPNAKMVHWKCTEHPEQCALNVDGSSYKNLKKAGYGGVIRDHQGNWIMGFSGHVDYVDSLHAELSAILNGLLVAWELEIKKVVCRSDCLQATKFFTQHFVWIEYSHLIDAINDLVSRKSWEVKFEHVYREENQCADYMAKFGANERKDTKDMKLFKEPPDVLCPLVISDATGIRYKRI